MLGAGSCSILLSWRPYLGGMWVLGFHWSSGCNRKIWYNPNIQATLRAIMEIGSQEADERLVLVVSDADLQRRGDDLMIWEWPGRDFCWPSRYNIDVRWLGIASRQTRTLALQAIHADSCSKYINTSGSLFWLFLLHTRLVVHCCKFEYYQKATVYLYIAWWKGMDDVILFQPRQWNQILHKDPSVKAYVILISNNVDEALRREGHDWCQDDSHRLFVHSDTAGLLKPPWSPTFWAKAERIKATLSPGRAHICAETASLAITFKQIFRDSMYLGHPWTFLNHLNKHSVSLRHPHSNTSPCIYSTPVWLDFFAHLLSSFPERSPPCEVERSLSIWTPRTLTSMSGWSPACPSTWISSTFTWHATIQFQLLCEECAYDCENHHIYPLVHDGKGCLTTLSTSRWLNHWRQNDCFLENYAQGAQDGTRRFLACATKTWDVSWRKKMRNHALEELYDSMTHCWKFARKRNICHAAFALQHQCMPLHQLTWQKWYQELWVVGPPYTGILNHFCRFCLTRSGLQRK